MKIRLLPCLIGFISIQLLLLSLIYLYFDETLRTRQLSVSSAEDRFNIKVKPMEKYKLPEDYPLELQMVDSELREIYLQMKEGTIQIYNKENITNSKLLILIEVTEYLYLEEQRKILKEFKQVTEKMKDRIG